MTSPRNSMQIQNPDDEDQIHFHASHEDEENQPLFPQQLDILVERDPTPPNKPNKWLKAITDSFKHIFPVYREDRIGSVNFPQDKLDEEGAALKTYHIDEQAYIDYEAYINDPKVRFMAFIGLRHEKLYDSKEESFFWNVLRNIIGDTRRKQDLVENIFSAGYNILKTVLSVAITLPMAIVKTVVEFLPEAINRLSFQAMKASYQWGLEENELDLDENDEADSVKTGLPYLFEYAKFLTRAAVGLTLIAFTALGFFVSGVARFVTRAIMSPMQAVKEAYLFGETRIPHARDGRFEALFDILGVTLGLVLAGLSLAVSIGFYAAVPYALVHYAPQVIAYATLHNMPHLLQLGQLIATAGSVVGQIGASVAASLSAIIGVNVSATVTTIGLLAAVGLTVPTLAGIGKWVAGKISDLQFGKYQAARAELEATRDQGVRAGVNLKLNHPFVQKAVNLEANIKANTLHNELRVQIRGEMDERKRGLDQRESRLVQSQEVLRRRTESIQQREQDLDEEKQKLVVTKDKAFIEGAKAGLELKDSNTNQYVLEALKAKLPSQQSSSPSESSPASSRHRSDSFSSTSESHEFPSHQSSPTSTPSSSSLLPFDLQGTGFNLKSGSDSSPGMFHRKEQHHPSSQPIPVPLSIVGFGNGQG